MFKSSDQINLTVSQQVKVDIDYLIAKTHPKLSQRSTKVDQEN